MASSEGRRCGLGVLGTTLLWISGCGSGETAPHPLNPEAARAAVQKALLAWQEGRKPADLKPEIVIGDTAWEQGRKLVAFEVVTSEETTDGSNLHIRVRRTFENNGARIESKVTWIVGTHPVITIFPQ